MAEILHRTAKAGQTPDVDPAGKEDLPQNTTQRLGAPKIELASRRNAAILISLGPPVDLISLDYTYS